MEIYAYCIMTSHVHLIFRAKDAPYDSHGVVSFAASGSFANAGMPKNSNFTLGTDGGFEWGVKYNWGEDSFIDAINSFEFEVAAQFVDIIIGESSAGLSGGVDIGAAISSIAIENVSYLGYTRAELKDYIHLIGGGLKGDSWRVSSKNTLIIIDQYFESTDTGVPLIGIGNGTFHTDGYNSSFIEGNN
jgi:hypothetical protein